MSAVSVQDEEFEAAFEFACNLPVRASRGRVPDVDASTQHDIEALEASVAKRQRAGPAWSEALAHYARKPAAFTEVLRSDDLCVTVEDKYPKARYHWLIIARGDQFGTMPSPLTGLRKADIELLRHMRTAAEELVASQNMSTDQFSMGLPSMRQLHMHVISLDYVSPALKTKKHWNSFTTEFFVPASTVIEILEDALPGTEARALKDLLISEDSAEMILKEEMECCNCGATLKNMPALKSHQEQCTSQASFDPTLHSKRSPEGSAD
eukprot:scaffold6592_cov411-Prasinococcus_capsulatus_cf.AAC.10